MTEDSHLDESTRELYENAPCGYLFTLPDGSIVRVNQTFLSWTGYSREDLLSAKFQDLLTVPGKIYYETHYAPLLQMQGFVKEIAFDLVCKQGPPLPVLANSTKESRLDRPAIIRCIIIDATDRRKYEEELLRARHGLEEEVRKRTTALEREVLDRRHAEENLRELTSTLLKLQDDERRRIARELHDSVGQLVAAMGMNITLVKAQSHKLNAAGAAAVVENQELLAEISKEIRTMSHLLHPTLLDELGLVSAVHIYVEGYSSRSNIQVEVIIEKGFGRLSNDLEIACFRIIQECLTNVHRHSKSPTATIRISKDGERIVVEVRDQGRGIPRGRLVNLRSSGGGGVGLGSLLGRWKSCPTNKVPPS